MEKGRLIIREIEFQQLLKRKVIQNNATSGKVQLPKKLIGRKVYVVIPEKEDGKIE